MILLPFTASFTEYSVSTQSAMAAMLFFAVLAQLAFVLTLFSLRAKSARRAGESTVLAFSIAALSYVTAVFSGSDLPLRLPWILVPTAAAFLAARALACMARLVGSAKRELPPDAAQKALDEEGYRQAQEALARETEELKRTNEELQAMYERLSDSIREQESLALKTRVHDSIGAALIAISNLMRGGEGNAEEQIEALRDAVSYFGNPDGAQPQTIVQAVSKAASLGVTLHMEGSVPAGGPVEELLAAAAFECAANCIKHAGGSQVFARVTQEENAWQARFTNDGMPPEKSVTEGGGLSALRKRVEEAGGSMRIESNPAFALIIKIPKENPSDGNPILYDKIVLS